MIVINRKNSTVQLNLTDNECIIFNQFLGDLNSGKIIIAEEVDRIIKIEVDSNYILGRPIHIRYNNLSREIQLILNKLIEI